MAQPGDELAQLEVGEATQADQFAPATNIALEVSNNASPAHPDFFEMTNESNDGDPDLWVTYCFKADDCMQQEWIIGIEVHSATDPEKSGHLLPGRIKSVVAWVPECDP